MDQSLPATEITALLGRGTRFEGKLYFEGRVRIDGVFAGEIKSDDTLIIGDGAEVSAEIDVATVIVRGGSVHGNVRAKTSLEIHAPAKLVGNIHSPSRLHRSRRRVPGKLPDGSSRGPCRPGEVSREARPRRREGPPGPAGPAAARLTKCGPCSRSFSRPPLSRWTGARRTRRARAPRLHLPPLPQQPPRRSRRRRRPRRPLRLLSPPSTRSRPAPRRSRRVCARSGVAISRAKLPRPRAFFFARTLPTRASALPSWPSHRCTSRSRTDAATFSPRLRQRPKERSGSVAPSACAEVTRSR